MTGALGQIPEYESLVRIFEYLDNPFIAVLLGLVLTVIVQSSSVTVSAIWYYWQAQDLLNHWHVYTLS